MSQYTTEVDRVVGARVKEARKALGWSLRRLSEECGKTPAELSEYERGLRVMTLTSLWLVARGLGRPVAWLFDGMEAKVDKAGAPLDAKLLALGGTVKLARRRRRGRRR